ncbi:MAG: (Fe-S)-binding protein [Ginsengibacter sp.]
MRVQLFVPCFVDQIYPHTAFNMVKVLEKACCDISYNTNQTCCGQPAYNAGFRDECKSVAAKFINDFDNSDYIVAPSASCVGFVRNYYTELFRDSSQHNPAKDLSSRIFEFTEFLTKIIKIENFGAELHVKATYHDSCAALRECKIKEEPRRLLEKVTGLELIEMADAETCCGFGGTFAVKFDSISVAMADQKLRHVLDSGATHIISSDISCLMHLQGVITKKKLPLTTMHIADVLASGWE